MNLTENDKKSLKLPIMLFIGAIVVLIISKVLLTKVMSPELVRILPLYIMFIGLFIFNWYLSMSAAQQIAIVTRTDFNTLFTLVPVASALEYASLYADFRKEVSNKRVTLIWIPMLITELMQTVTLSILITNIAIEGLYYETDEVSFAFMNWILSFILYNTCRNLIISAMLSDLKTKTYKKNVKIPFIINSVTAVMFTLIFIVGRFIHFLARAFNFPILNIILLILLPIVFPIYTSFKTKSVVKDIKLSQTPEERLG